MSRLFNIVLQIQPDQYILPFLFLLLKFYQELMDSNSLFLTCGTN